MAKIDTLQHRWVRLTQTPVEVLSDSDGDPVVFIDPDMEAEAQAEAPVGCLACDSFLDGYTYRTECDANIPTE